MKKYVGISELASIYSAKHEITKKEAEKRVKELMGIIEDVILDPNNSGLQIVNKFTLQKMVRKEKVGRNPKNSSVTIHIPERIGIKCVLGKELDSKLNNKDKGCS